MKKIIEIICIAALLNVATSCNDDFLERYPLSSLSPDTYFQTEAELKAYTNAFYDQFPDALTLAGYHSYFDDLSANSVPDLLRGGRVVPASGGGWDWSFLRRINFMLDNSHKCTDEKIRARYDGIALFFRTWFYFEKIQMFGDVPWYDHVLGTNDEELYKARDPRELVFNNMLEDINYAIDHLPTARNTTSITKWTALALKSRICLWEGTFRKYHGLNGWETILNECVDASDNLIAKGGYRVYTSTKDKAYQELFVFDEANPNEIILARPYSKKFTSEGHTLNNYFFSEGLGKMGFNRSFINSYLKTDGSRFTDGPNYLTMQWYEEFQDRDPRLSQTVRAPGFKRMQWDALSVPTFGNCVTGYHKIKYVVDNTSANDPNFFDLPIFRYAEILLNYAEAKAELGEITQGDIDKSIKLLRDRVEMPNLIVADANQNPDPYLADQYRRVTGANKGVILEIRRERRIELVCEYNHRTMDIWRWKEGHLFTQVWNGMYFPGTGEYDMDHDGIVETVIYEGDLPAPQNPNQRYLKLGRDFVLENGAAGGQIITCDGMEKFFDEKRDYFYPIPTQDRQLNPNLTQNPEWPLQ